MTNPPVVDLLEVPNPIILEKHQRIATILQDARNQLAQSHQGDRWKIIAALRKQLRRLKPSNNPIKPWWAGRNFGQGHNWLKPDPYQADLLQRSVSFEEVKKMVLVKATDSDLARHIPLGEGAGLEDQHYKFDLRKNNDNNHFAGEGEVPDWDEKDAFNG